MEYILCIEGMGWPTNENNLDSGFDGDVFVTNDLNGDLATVLDCTIHKTLQLPDSIEDSIDQVTLKYEVGGMSFQIVDQDSFLLANLTPNKTGSETAISSELPYNSTTVVIEVGTNFAASAKAWVGGRELVLLGTKAGTSPAVYTGCTRGYLGTGRGRADTDPPASNGLAWPAGSTVYSLNRYVYDRRVNLYAHVPGEADSACVLIWSGRIRSINVSDHTTWQIECAGTSIVGGKEEIFRPTNWLASQVSGGPGGGGLWSQANSANVEPLPSLDLGGTVGDLSVPVVLKLSRTVDAANKDNGALGLAAFYHYRTEPGGTNGMRQFANTTTPQARTVGNFTRTIGQMMKVGVNTYYAVSQYQPTNSSVTTAAQSDRINAYKFAYGSGVPNGSDQVRFLLDNSSDDYRINRFSSNKKIFKNPIDVLLCFLTSCNDEFYINDVTGGTTTVPTFPTGVGATDLWDGYALFCVEGDNKDEARTITASSNTSITVERAYTNTPTALTEYQVRNTLWDVLPLGFGLCVHNSRIDLDSFADVRSKFLSGATVGTFSIGTKDRLDLLEFVVENICAPFGIVLHFARSTGKLTAKYVGEALGDGISETYTALTTDDIVSYGDLDYSINQPTTSVNLKIRSSGQLEADGELKQDVITQSPEVKNAYATSKATSVNMTAAVLSVEELDTIEPYIMSMLRRNAIPPPVIGLSLTLDNVLTISAGTYVSLTVADFPVDPYNGSRGLTARPGLVLSTRLDIASFKLDCSVMLLPGIVGALIAPAAVVASRASNALTVGDGNFVEDTDLDKDWWHFAVGDLIALYSVLGVFKAGPQDITSFGANSSSTPEGADTSVINITSGLGWTIATDDYVTFYDYRDTQNTARMDKYSAYGNSSASVLDGDDAFKQYA